MSLGTQFKNLARGAARFRSAVFGQDAEGKRQRMQYDGEHTFFGYFSPIRYQHQAEGLNLRETVDCVLRFDKSALPTGVVPDEGKRFLIYGAKPDGTDLTVRMEQFVSDHPLNPEWVLGCKQL